MKINSGSRIRIKSDGTAEGTAVYYKMEDGVEVEIVDVISLSFHVGDGDDFARATLDVRAEVDLVAKVE